MSSELTAAEDSAGRAARSATHAQQGPPVAHVQLVEVGKHYGGVQALEAVSLTVTAGYVHSLVGENGAGKSTVGKIVGGIVSPDSGQLLIRGRKVHYRTPHEASVDGVVYVAQEVRLVPQRSVRENVFLGVESRRLGMYDSRDMDRRFAELCDRAGMRLPAERLVRTLSVGQQQQVEILRALAREPELLILDEPTAALTRSEVTVLFDLIRALRAGGTTVIYVSHFLDEVLEISDEISVLRDGRLIRSGKAAAETPQTLIEGMVGRSVGLDFPAKALAEPATQPVLAVEGLSGGKVKDVSFQIRPGEIVGVAGLMGSGRTSLARLLFGADRRTAGVVRLDGREVRFGSPNEAIRAGVVMMPESRKEHGLVMQRPVRENLSLVYGRDASSAGVVSRKSEETITNGLMARLDIRGRVAAPVAALSGGNQQKVVLAKWLWRDARVLIVDEPARGIDIAAKVAMYRLIAELAKKGSAIVMVSSEIEALLGLAHRVIVMRAGRAVAELEGDAISEHAIVAASFGETS